MDLVSRDAILIKKKQPYLDWVKNLPDPITDITLQELNQDCQIYLIPDYEDPNDIEEYIESIYELILEQELFAWHTDEKDWPDNISYKKFKECFGIEFHSMVIDVVDGKIKKESLY